MKKLLMILIALFSVALPFVSCTDDESEDTVYLHVDETNITFEAPGETYTIPVDCDYPDWRVFATTEWLQAKREGDNIEVVVSTNPTVEDRSCSIILIAGGANENIEVVQHGAKGDGTLSPNEISIDQFGGTKTVDVVCNDPHWEASTEADWIKLTPKPYKYELDITYAENVKREGRTARILIKMGKINKEIVVVQSGILFYLLPYLDFHGNIKDIKAFESARHSQLLERFPHATDWNYDTTSPFFPRVRYFMKDARGTAIKEVHAFAPSIEEFRAHMPEFISFLEDHGFVKQPDEDFVFFNEELSVAAEINLMEDKKIAGVAYVYMAKQEKEYPTFSSFPAMDELPWGATNEEIQAYEKNHGGTVQDAMTKIDPEEAFDMLAFDVKSTDPESPFFRLYLTGHDKSGMMFKDGVIVKDCFYRNTQLAFYQGASGDYYLTKEFIELTKQNGYKMLDGDQNGYIIFVNADTNTTMKVKVNAEFQNSLEILLQRTDGMVQAAAASSLLHFGK